MNVNSTKVEKFREKFHDNSGTSILIAETAKGKIETFLFNVYSEGLIISRNMLQLD